MRAVVDSVVAVMLALVLGGILIYQRAEREEDDAVTQTRTAVQVLAREIRMRGAAELTDVNGRGWPMTVSSDWFDADLPTNATVTGDRPWVEVARPEHAELVHPPNRIALDNTIAAFWYNPGNGVVRARVPVLVSDRKTTELYNDVNATSLSSIFHDWVPPAAGGAIPEGMAPANPSAPAVAEGNEYNASDMDPTSPLLSPIEEAKQTADALSGGDDQR